MSIGIVASEWFPNGAKVSNFRFSNFGLSNVTILETKCQSYDLNAFLRDIISGLTVACIRLPQDRW